MKSDQLFQDPNYQPPAFQFDEQVTAVFDDMLTRSIPCYWSLQHALISSINTLSSPTTRIYDLGCSTGTTLGLLSQHLRSPIDLIGIDLSPPMLEKCKERWAQLPAHPHQATWIEHNLNQPFPFQTCDAVILNLVLQFIDPLHRPLLLSSLYQALKPGGSLYLVEKITPNNSSLSPAFTQIYHAFKHKNGYTLLEIERKQTALKNVLIPLTPQQNIQLLKTAGFTTIEPFFQWVSFQGILAIK